VAAKPILGFPPASSKSDPMEEIARTMEVAKRMGDGKLMGYDWSSSSLSPSTLVAAEEAVAMGDDSTAVTAGSTFGGAFF